MKTIDLFVTRNEKVVTNIPKETQREKLRSLKTRYVAFSSYDENNEYTGLDIELRSINCEEGVAHFEICKEGFCQTHFTMNTDDDPLVVFKNEPGFEHHIFEKTVQYEINQEIKRGGLYKFHNPSTNVYFLAVVQTVSPSLITLSKLSATRFKKSSPARYSLYQEGNIFNISVSDKFKNFVVTKLCDLTTMFADEDYE